jgi:hypothetical protein
MTGSLAAIGQYTIQMAACLPVASAVAPRRALEQDRRLRLWRWEGKRQSDSSTEQPSNRNNPVTNAPCLVTAGRQGLDSWGHQ